MSITMKAVVTFPLTIIINTETMQYIAEARQKCRDADPAKFAEAKGHERFKVELFLSDKTDEEVAQVIYRASMREFIRRDMTNELKTDECSARIGDIKVTFADKSTKAGDPVTGLPRSFEEREAMGWDNGCV